MRKIGEYAVEGKLGEGGMGVVLRARAPDGRAVALKIVQRPSDEIAARFERERRLLGSFGLEQGFVPLIDGGEVPQGPYIVMPLLEGGTLRDRIEGGALPVAAVLAIGRRIVHAVALAHERGIVHRDLKPENVLFTKEGEPLVADLGLAKHFSRDALDGSRSVTLSRTNEFRGTLRYMALEQMEDAKSVGPQADVFALGAILYECLAGQPAFHAEETFAIIGQIRGAKYVPLRRLRPEVPGWLEALIVRCLEAEPAARYADARQLENALRGPRSAAARAPLVAGALLAGAVGLGGLALALERSMAGEKRTPSSPPPAPVTTTARPAPPGLADLLDDMKRAFDAKDWPRVIDLATKASDLDGSCARAFAYRAEAKHSLGRFRESRDDYSSALELDPQAAGIWLGRARARFNLDDFAGARDDADRAITLGCDDELAYEVRGQTRVRLGDAKEGLADLDLAVAKGGRSVAVLGDRGVAHLRLGERREAIADLDAALAIAPRRDDLLANRGIAKQQLGDAKGALADFDAAIALDGKVGLYHATRGSLLLDAHDTRGARDALEKAVQLDARDDYAWVTLGRAREAMNDDDGAVDAYDSAIAAHPEKAPAFVNRGNIRNKKGEYAKAIEDYSKALSIDDRIAAAWTGRGNAKQHAGDPAGAIADHTKAIELGLAIGYKNRALAKKEARDLDGAIADLDRYFELVPDNPIDAPNRNVLKVWKLQRAAIRKQQGGSSARGDDPSGPPR